MLFAPRPIQVDVTKVVIIFLQRDKRRDFSGFCRAALERVLLKEKLCVLYTHVASVGGDQPPHADFVLCVGPVPS